MQDLLTQVKNVCASRAAYKAISHGTDVWTYGDLQERIDRIRSGLGHTCLSPGDRLCIALESSFDYIACLYAAWACQLIAVPCSHQSTEAELSKVVHSTQSKLLVTASEKHQAISSADVQCIEISALSNYEQAQSELPHATIENAAMILMTSGTTGNPKGVTLSHSNLAHNTHAICQYLSITHEDKTLTALPFYYSYGNSVLHTHLTQGAELRIGPSAAFLSKWKAVFEDETLTGFSTVPTTLELMIKKNVLTYAQSGLRYVTLAGGPASSHLLEHIGDMFTKAQVFVMYGQTEASARISYLPPEALPKKPHSVGIPLAGVNIDIRDEHGTSLPVGETGEVCISGNNVMLGYWQNETATRETLSNGWLMTGDLGYKDEDGFLFLKGRKSEIIKSGGNRILPPEIEEVLNLHPDVIESAVVGNPDDQYGEIPIAFVVTSADSGSLEKQLKRHCRQLLSTYKQPKKYYFVDQLPKTASGKLKRSSLRDEN